MSDKESLGIFDLKVDINKLKYLAEMFSDDGIGRASLALLRKIDVDWVIISIRDGFKIVHWSNSLSKKLGSSDSQSIIGRRVEDLLNTEEWDIFLEGNFGYMLKKKVND